MKVSKNAEASATPKKHSNAVLRNNLTGYAFILPQMLLFLVFIVYPVFEGMRMSLFKTAIKGETFVGFANYISLFQDKVFMQSMVNTVVFVIAIVACTVIFGLFVASCVFDKSTKYISFVRGAYYIPVMVSMTVMAMVWSFLLNPANGLVGYLMRSQGMNYINLLGNKNTVLPVVIFVTFTTNVGQAIILYIAAMIGIPRDLFEAAEVDGASRIKRIVSIVLPLTKPTTLYILVINIINVLKIFVVIQLLTGGGPNNASTTMMFYLYNSAFKNNQVNKASAIGVMMFIIAMLLSLPQLRSMFKKS